MLAPLCHLVKMIFVVFQLLAWYIFCGKMRCVSLCEIRKLDFCPHFDFTSQCYQKSTQGPALKRTCKDNVACDKWIHFVVKILKMFGFARSVSPRGVSDDKWHFEIILRHS